jgi:hypothetical protein
VCSSIDHWAKKCSHHKGRKPQSAVNIVTIVVDGTSGYTKFPSVLCVSIYNLVN